MKKRFGHATEIIHMCADVIVAIFDFMQLHPDNVIISHRKEFLLP
jgi:hypothetical protein